VHLSGKGTGIYLKINSNLAEILFYRINEWLHNFHYASRGHDEKYLLNLNPKSEIQYPKSEIILNAMCFSAGASFAGGAVLSAIGVATIKTNHNPSHKLFAGVPLFFAFQQFSEGVLWLALRPGGDYQLQEAAAYIFLLMALVIWPSMIPLAVLKMETVPRKRKILKGLVVTGTILSAYYSFCLLSFPVSPVINSFHIQYINGFPHILGYIAFGIYVIATLTPLFVSSVRKMSLFGILIFISCFITGVFYKEYLTSVWCFFAALISVVVYVIIREAQPEYHAESLRLLKIFSDYNPLKNRFR
jgi:hypothetical protein